MKKKCLIAVAVAGMMMASQITAYASSISGGIYDVDYGYGSSSDDDSSSSSGGATSTGGTYTGSGSFVNAGPGAVNAPANTNGTVTINEANVPLASGPLAAALGFHTTASATSIKQKQIFD